MERQETETEIAYLLRVTQNELDNAGIEFVCSPEQAVAVRFGVTVGEEPNSYPWFVEVVKRTDGGSWEYALPIFENRHTAGYKGRVEAAHNDNLIRAFIQSRVPDWQERLKRDQEILEGVMEES